MCSVSWPYVAPVRVLTEVIPIARETLEDMGRLPPSDALMFLCRRSAFGIEKVWEHGTPEPAD